MSEELKPCPFCGGEAELCRIFGRIGISCKQCNVGIRSEEISSEAGYDEVYIAWNTRPSPWIKIDGSNLPEEEGGYFVVVDGLADYCYYEGGE